MMLTYGFLSCLLTPDGLLNAFIIGSQLSVIMCGQLFRNFTRGLGIPACNSELDSVVRGCSDTVCASRSETITYT